MKSKKIALFSCAALVAAGVGLNIQNAIENYGIGENSLSLVATGGTGSSGSSSCVESVSFGTCTYSGTDVETVVEEVMRCGRGVAGKWKIIGKAVGKASGVGLGITIWLEWGPQLTHYKWEEYKEPTGRYEDNGKGQKKPVLNWYEKCEHKKRPGWSECDPARGENFKDHGTILGD